MTKKQLTPEQEAMLDEIDLALGIPLKPKKVPKVLMRKLPEKWNELTEACRIAYILENRRIWKPVGVVAYTITQTCLCCGGEVTYIGNRFIRHQHTHSNTIWDYQMPESPDYRTLPRIYTEHLTTVPECASCFRTNTLQACHHHAYNAPCGCETKLSDTTLWQDVDAYSRQPDLFLQEKPNGAERTPEEFKPVDGNTDSSESGGFNALKYAIPRPSDATLDLRDKKPDNTPSVGGVLQ